MYFKNEAVSERARRREKVRGAVDKLPDTHDGDPRFI
jgi:hypothetical protein